MSLARQRSIGLDDLLEIVPQPFFILRDRTLYHRHLDGIAIRPRPFDATQCEARTGSDHQRDARDDAVTAITAHQCDQRTGEQQRDQAQAVLAHDRSEAA
jgi:hypothetical protein